MTTLSLRTIRFRDNVVNRFFCSVPRRSRGAGRQFEVEPPCLRSAASTCLPIRVLADATAATCSLRPLMKQNFKKVDGIYLVHPTTSGVS